MSKLRPAAGIIPLRRTGERGLEALLVQRGKSGSFFPGYWAFPGGGQEKSDLEALPEDPYRACALREMLEETGLWPAEPCPGAAERAALLGGELTISELLARYPAPPLRKAGLRNTPDYAGIRFSAQFYAAVIPGGAEPKVQAGELEQCRWWRVTQVERAWRDSEIFLAPPTLLAIQQLCRSQTWLEAAAALESVDPNTEPPIPVCPGLSYVPLETPTLPPARHTLAYLCGEERLMIVDPGSSDPGQLELLERAIATVGLPVQAVLFSHHHPDHVGGQRWARQNGYPIWCHRETASRLAVETSRLIEEGEQLGSWTALHTPGHAPGHLALWNAGRRILLAGDLVSSLSTILVPPDEGNMAQYLNSLQRCEQLGPELVLSAHGGPFGPGSDLLGRTRRHRLEREAKIVSCLGDRPLSFDALFDIAYSDCAPAARPAGRMSLESHLVKLVDEARVLQTPEGWRLLESAGR